MVPASRVVEQDKSYSSCRPTLLNRRFATMIVLLGAALLSSCGRSGEGALTPTPAVHVSVSPSTAQVALLGQFQFSSAVSGSSAGVTWSVNGIAGGTQGLGVIDSTGLYIAPTTLPSPNMVTVTATSLADSTQSASAAVAIVNPPPSLVSISPPALPVGSSNTRLTITGTGFTSQSVVQAGGAALPTVYWNPRR